MPELGPFLTYWSPEGPAAPTEPGVAPILRVTGHFDDAASDSCTIAIGEPEQIPVDPVIARLYCRSHFVLDEYETLGTDEDFPFG